VGPEAGLNDAVKEEYYIRKERSKFIRDFSKGKGMTPEDHSKQWKPASRRQKE